MKKLILLVAVFLMWPNRPVFAWNPVTDLRENVIWTFGKAADIGTAVKLTGSDTQMKDGETATSMLAGIADYRFLTLSYGGTQTNKAGTTMTDTMKVGLRLTSFFDLFTHPTTPEMAWMKNINVGPSLSLPLFSTPRVGILLLDANYRFGGS